MDQHALEPAGEGPHSEVSAGPRAALGSQRPPTRLDVQIDPNVTVQSEELRAEDGSRSVAFRPAAALEGAPGCAGASGGNSVAEPEMVRFQASPIHGTGGFAKADIRKGTRILEYLGEKISKGESLRRCVDDNEYIFTLSDEQDLDGNVAWNPARFVNHSCTPNCEAELDEGRIWIVAARDIRAGEEITFNYGYDLEEYQAYPCRCGSPQCVGYIVAEEFFEHVRGRSTGRL